MDQTEHLGLRRVLHDGLQACLIVVHVFLHFTALNIEHVYKDLNILKHIVSLTCKVAVPIGTLPMMDQ